jgi:hypothetical protein
MNYPFEQTPSVTHLGPSRDVRITCSLRLLTKVEMLVCVPKSVLLAPWYKIPLTLLRC